MGGKTGDAQRGHHAVESTAQSRSTEAPLTVRADCCDSIDFNNDTSLFEPSDIDRFMLVFSEGPCTLCGQ